MLKKIITRILLLLFVLVGVSILIFSIARIIPGDPARLALGAGASQEQVAQLRQELHLDKPLHQQYSYFVKGVLKGDLGKSLFSHMPVTSDIAKYLPATLELILVSTFFIIIIGIPLGILSIRYENKWIDHIIRFLSISCVAAPSFLWAVIFMLVFAYSLDWFPISGRISNNFEDLTQDMPFILLTALFRGNWSMFFDALLHIILPAFTLAIPSIGQAIRLTVANMKTVMNQPYMETVRAYNLSNHLIYTQYGLRPAIIPMLTILGLDVASMLGNAFLVEVIFAWPGLASYGVKVVLYKDLNSIVGVVLVMACFFLIINFIIDSLVSYINPRIRFGEER